MALGAMAKYPGLDVPIIPCGLFYFHADRFRSRAMVEYGQPIKVESRLVEDYKKGGEFRRNAISELLKIIYRNLMAVTVNAPDFETLQVIQAAKRLYKQPKTKMNPFAELELTRRLIKGYTIYKDNSRIVKLKEKVLEYNDLLLAYGLKDHEVKKTILKPFQIIPRLITRLIGLLFLFSFSLPGVLLNAPIAVIANIISTKKAHEAKMSSSVKISGKDVLATWKLLVGLVLIPSLYFIYTLISLYFLSYFGVITNWNFYAKLFLGVFLDIIVFPTISYAAIRFGEIGLGIFRSLKPLALASFKPAKAKELRNKRKEIKKEIITVVSEFGPNVYSDLNNLAIAQRIHIVSDEEDDAAPSPLVNWSLLGNDFDEMWKQVEPHEIDDYFFKQ
ncbi:hypothetical protein ROZALSC1DRAFT_17781 [Rozella allomycis CSF55]|uniref:Phospholipid/glycerol acyltransferase domain-containing protein n=1 Tax=Rozella allomycis (strain CSF55) TaxID=988480 RepID=A0A4V1IYZ4_ROZAC|nr:hypothetical protein ROZALSC1DRAFT_17781 [Rozella allomycis CSF55]